MAAKGDEIIGTMTIREAAERWSDPRSGLLKRWGETFGVQLQELHPGHVETYQKDRGEDVGSSQVDAEVGALLVLLKELGLGADIERYNHSLSESGELTTAEFRTLPEAVQKYIQRLKREVAELSASNERMKNRIRRTNWGRSR
jgi:hypothetical protein